MFHQRSTSCKDLLPCNHRAVRVQMHLPLGTNQVDGFSVRSLAESATSPRDFSLHPARFIELDGLSQTQVVWKMVLHHCFEGFFWFNGLGFMAVLGGLGNSIGISQPLGVGIKLVKACQPFCTSSEVNIRLKVYTKSNGWHEKPKTWDGRFILSNYYMNFLNWSRCSQ